MSSQPDLSSHDFITSAFAVVSMVLKDLEEIIKSVVSGLIVFFSSSICSPSILEMKNERVFSSRY